jgi:hypothetical protein
MYNVKEVLPNNELANGEKKNTNQMNSKNEEKLRIE